MAAFKYQRQYLYCEAENVQRHEIEWQLTDWVPNPRQTLVKLESNPGEWFRLIPYCSFRTVPNEEETT